MKIRCLGQADSSIFFELRVFALQEAPAAFLVSPEEEQEQGERVWRERLAQPPGESFILGAFEEERLVGTIGCLRNTRAKARHKAGFWGVYVHPKSRGHGIGKELMQHAIRKAKESMGVELIQLGVNVENANAHSLYESMGFVTYGIERDGFRVEGKSADEYLMALRLEEESKI